MYTKTQEWYKELCTFCLNSPLFNILLHLFYHLNSVSLPPSLPHSYTHTRIGLFFSFLNSLVHWIYHILLPLHSLFPRNKNILLCNHSALSNIGQHWWLHFYPFCHLSQECLFITVFLLVQDTVQSHALLLVLMPLQSPSIWNSSLIFFFPVFMAFGHLCVSVCVHLSPGTLSSAQLPLLL